MPASSSAISSSNCSFSGAMRRETEPSDLLRRDARLVERGGVDQVADGLGLRQIDAAVEEGAQVNSPGSARRAPASSARSTACRRTTGEPWQAISTTSSAV